MQGWALVPTGLADTPLYIRYQSCHIPICTPDPRSNTHRNFLPRLDLPRHNPNPTALLQSFACRCLRTLSLFV